MLGLPGNITVCLFDLDGVLTRTAVVHCAAWRKAFDEFLQARDGDGFQPFDPDRDYDEYIDGKPRADGVRDFLRSRRITLPEGKPDDAAGAATVNGLANRKNELLLAAIKRVGVEVYPGSVRYLQAAREAGLRRIVVSASANAGAVLHSTGLAALVEGRIDGLTLAERHLAGKPAPDSFLAGAALVGATPGESAVYEDSLAGVAAARTGGFGYVVGLDRVGQADALHEHGADIVVKDLDELLAGDR